MSFEILDVTLMFLRCVQCFERSEIFAPFCLGVFLPRIKPVFTRFKLPYLTTFLKWFDVEAILLTCADSPTVIT